VSRTLRRQGEVYGAFAAKEKAREVDHAHHNGMADAKIKVSNLLGAQVIARQGEGETRVG